MGEEPTGSDISDSHTCFKAVLMHCIAGENLIWLAWQPPSVELDGPSIGSIIWDACMHFNVDQHTSNVNHWCTPLLLAATYLQQHNPEAVQCRNACCCCCVHVLSRYGKPLRVAEMNTISNSGRAGVSDVMAAALWTVDASFEVAQAGGIGVNLHQGAGQNLYAAIIRW